MPFPEDIPFCMGEDPAKVGELVECRGKAGRRECRPERLPGEGNGGTLPVARTEIDGAECVLAPLAVEGRCPGGVPGFTLAGIGGK
jgi:hypothetical protein